MYICPTAPQDTLPQDVTVTLPTNDGGKVGGGGGGGGRP